MRRLISGPITRIAVIGGFYTVVSGSIAALGQNITSAKVAGDDAWLVGAILVTLGLVVYLTQRTQSMIQELRDKAGFSIRYYPAGDERASLDLYNAAREVIEHVEPGSRIYAVNSFVEVFKESMDASAESSRRNYLSSIDKKLGTVDYHRIIQLKPDDLDRTSQARLADLIAPNYLGHYREVAKFVRSHQDDPSVTRLDAVPALYPMSFVLVQGPEDNRGGNIIWQMNQHVLANGSTGGTIRADALKLTGVFIVHDPDGLLVRYFKQWFSQLQRSRNLRSIADEELGLEPE